MELIYCADGNRDYAQIAIDAGFTYGAQPLKKIYHPIDFADLDPDNIPPKGEYITALKRHRPKIATVADWTAWEQLPEVLGWAEESALYTETIIIIPKVIGGVARLPKKINGKEVRLGFSYPTGHGKADWSILYEMIGRPIHILGGPPQAVLAMYSGRFKAPRCRSRQPDLLTSALDIKSADGNYMLFLANKCLVWEGDSLGVNFRHISLKQLRGKKYGDGSKRAGASYEAFRQSCKNIMTAWRAALGGGG